MLRPLGTLCDWAYELCVAQLTFAVLAQNTYAYNFLAEHLKLKITITFNLAEQTEILHCDSQQRRAT